MLCYCCATQGADRPAVALCRDCGAGLCLEHLSETARRFAAGHMLETCHHATWSAPAAAPATDAAPAHAA